MEKRSLDSQRKSRPGTYNYRKETLKMNQNKQREVLKTKIIHTLFLKKDLDSQRGLTSVKKEKSENNKNK